MNTGQTNNSETFEDIKQTEENTKVLDKKTSQLKVKKGKKPKKKRARTAYNFFVKDKMKLLSNEDEWKDKKKSELMKECGQLWKIITEEDKKTYQDMAEEDKKKINNQVL